MISKIKELFKKLSTLSKIKKLARKINNLKLRYKIIIAIVATIIIAGVFVVIFIFMNQPITIIGENIAEPTAAGKDYVANEVLVQIGKTDGAQKSTDFAKINNLELINYDDSTGISKFRTKSDEELLNVIDENKQDYMIEPNWIYQASSIEGNPDSTKQWGYQFMDTKYAYAVTKGSGTKVAVIDTGIDVSHPEFSGRISSLSYNSCSKTNISADYQDKNGHGTHVSGIIGAADNNIGIIGVAPETEIVAIKAQCPESTDGSFSAADLVSAISYVATNQIDALNMSLGGYNRSDLIAAAIQQAINNGVVIIAAAGNEKSSALHYPSSYDGVISVSALESRYNQYNVITIAPDTGYTNYGARIDFAAPGTNIYSTYLDGGFKSLSGTSMASPQVAGVVALVMAQNPSYSVDQVKSALKDNAVDRGNPGKDDYYGWGAVNAGNIFNSNKKTVTLDYRFNSNKVTFNSIVGEKMDYPSTIQGNNAFSEKWYKDQYLRTLWNFETDLVQEDTTIYLRWVGEPDPPPPVSDEFTHYQQDGNYIFGFDSNAMSYTAVMAKIKRSWNEVSKIYRGTNIIGGSNAVVGTGDIIKTTMADGSQKSETIVLIGDIYIDGFIDTFDQKLIDSIQNGSADPLSTIELKAGDINNDGKVDKADADILKANQPIDQLVFRQITAASFNYKKTTVGDVYVDGIINSKDSTMIKRYLANLATLDDRQKIAADTNADGKINWLDSEIILRYVAKLYPSLPAIGVREMYGDANWDNKVDQSDVLSIQDGYLKYYSSNPGLYPWYSWYTSDVDLDGKVTTADAYYVSQYISGAISKLPVN